MKPLVSFLAFSLYVSAQVTVAVPGDRVITLAGQPAGTRSDNGARSAPAHSPIQVSIPLAAGQVLQFSATGAVDEDGPDGVPGCNTAFSAEFGIPRVDAPCRALLGVFLADSTRSQPPVGLSFVGDAKNHPVLRPLIQQAFMIGSGVTAEGVKKSIVVPNGATRLFLSPLGSSRSSGEFVVTVTQASMPEVPSNPIRVSAVSVINLAGQPAGTLSDNNNRIAPTNSPAQVGVPLTSGQVLRIVASGSVDGAGPDGHPGCNTAFVAEFSIPRTDARCRSLLGVFLADSTRSQPPGLNFTGAARNNVRVEPLIQQPFLIGSGYTDDGQLKQFVVPSGATRLFLAPLGTNATPGAFLVTVSPFATTTPALERTGVLRAAGFGGGAVSAGSIASIFGSNFADVTETAGSVPLPVQISRTRVYFNLLPAPLYFTSAGQINAQVPWELAGETSAQLVVVRNGAASLPVSVELGATGPGIFVLRENVGVVVNGATGQLVDAQTPARPGDTLVIYASGLGPVSANVITGAPASSTELEPLRQPAQASLSIAGQSITLPVAFSGSAPGFIGVNQVNAVIPANAPAGLGSLRLRAGGADSNAVQISIQR